MRVRCTEGILLALALFGAGCAASGSRPPAAAGKKGGDGVPVSVATVVVKDVPLDIQVIGNVEAFSTVTIRAQVSGMLQKVHFKEGDFVRKGDLLFSIDASPFDAALAEAEANLEKSEAQLSQAEATLSRDMAQEKYQRTQAARYTELARQGVMSKDQAEQVQSAADAQGHLIRADEAAIKSARATVAANRSAVATAKISLAYTTIRSPIDGRTGNLAAKEGNLVAANTTDLITINQVQPTYVTFAVPEARLPAIKQYMAAGRLPVMAQSQDGSSRDDSGVLSFVDNAVDTGTGTIRLKGTFANPGRKLWPGEFVRVTLRLARQPNALVVPNQAVQTGQDGLFVYVLKPDRTVESRPVTTGSRVDQDIVIEHGLEAGDTVVTEGQLRLAPGMRVRVRGLEGAPRGRAPRG